MSPALEHAFFVRCVAPARAHGDKRLAVDRTHARDQVPVQLTRSHAEIRGVREDVHAALPRQQERILWEPYVIADTKAEPGILRVENGELRGPWVHVVAFKEGYAVRNVHIKQVLLAVAGCDAPFRIEAKARVVDSTVVVNGLRNAPSNNVSICISSKLCQHLGCHTAIVVFEALYFDRLSVLQHELLLKRRDEHFRKHDDLGTSRRSICDHALGCVEVLSFVLDGFDLAEGHLEHLTAATACHSCSIVCQN